MSRVALDESNWRTTRSIGNIFVIGDHEKAWISLPKAKGIKLTIAEERDVRRKAAGEAL